MAFDTKQYIDQLAQSAGLSQEEKDAILKVTANEKFSQALGNDVLRQQDYSRNMDALKTDRQKWEKYYADLAAWEANEKTRWEQEFARLGNVDPERPVIQPVQANLDEFEKKMKAELDRRDQVQISLLKDGMRLASAHVYEFKEPLDTDALAKIAVDKGMTLRQAYDEMVAPRRTELTAAQQKAAIETARQEGARDALAKHQLPIDAQPREYHVMFDRDPSKQVGAQDYVPNTGQLSPTASRNLRDNFVDEWNKAGQATSSNT